MNGRFKAEKLKFVHVLRKLEFISGLTLTEDLYLALE
jgi:hypothetical protein